MSVDFSEYFYYDETSPTFLRWKKNIYYGRYKTTLKASAGSIAGSKDVYGYWQVKLSGKVYKVHRIIWKIHGKDLDPKETIDHVDGEKENNSISNLRVVSCKINARNRGMQSNNKTGVVGVAFLKSNNSYKAQYVGTDGKVASKCFKLLKYGQEEAFRLACEFRMLNMELLNLVGEGYTDRHINATKLN